MMHSANPALPGSEGFELVHGGIMWISGFDLTVLIARVFNVSAIDQDFGHIPED